MTTEVLQPPKLGASRLLLLGASSVVLFMSYLMAVFTPFPVTMAVVLYGRIKGYLVALLGVLVCLLVGHFFASEAPFLMALFYGCMIVFASLIAESLLRDWPPVRVVVISGALVIVTLAGLASNWLIQHKLTPQAYVTQEVQEAIRQLDAARKEGRFSQDLIDLGLGQPPAEIAQQVLEHLPGYLCMAIFFILWVNMYLSLKGRRLLNPANVVAHDETELLSFRMPFPWIYSVVVGLALVVGADYLPYAWASAVGMNILRLVGVFYFFQGFGVMLAFLNHYGVMGFFRTLLVMGIVFLAPAAIALVGLFDTWFDFTKKLKKQNTVK